MTAEDAKVLHAEVLALQAVLMAVFRRLVRDRPELDGLFRQAFDEAETILSGVATKAGLEDSLGTTTGALQIIDELRLAVIRPRPAAAGQGEIDGGSGPDATRRPEER